MSKIVAHVLTLSCLIGAVGCEASGREPSARSCERHFGAVPLRYVGQAFGDGSLSIERDPDRGAVARIVVAGEGEGGPVLDFSGPAACDDGVVRVSFGAADHPEAVVKVVGGALVAVPPRDAGDRWFGSWTATVIRKRDSETREIEGFFREPVAGTPIAPEALAQAPGRAQEP